jgi:hypothetical protein
MQVKQARARRRAVANAVAPGAENGIGARIVRGDRMREATMATGLTAEEIERRARAEQEEEARLAAATPMAVTSPVQETLRHGKRSVCFTHPTRCLLR